MDVDGYSLWVSGGSLLLVAPQVSEAECRATLSSLRYAQWLADGLVGSRFDAHRQWYRAYRTALGTCGWGVSYSCQSVEAASCRTLIAPLQPLQLWLATQHSQVASVMERCIDGLDTAQPGIEQLGQSALRVMDQPPGGAQIVLELGVLRAGAELSLCSLSLQTRATLGADWLTAVLAGEQLCGDLSLQGVLAEPAPELRDTGRDAFARLVCGSTSVH